RRWTRSSPDLQTGPPSLTARGVAGPLPERGHHDLSIPAGGGRAGLPRPTPAGVPGPLGGQAAAGGARLQRRAPQRPRPCSGGGCLHVVLRAACAGGCLRERGTAGLVRAVRAGDVRGVRAAGGGGHFPGVMRLTSPIRTVRLRVHTERERTA